MRVTRRKAQIPFAAIPLLVGFYLLSLIIRFPVTAVEAANIVYISPHFYKLPVMLLYVAASCISCLFSSEPKIRTFGALALLLFALANEFFNIALFSVWCFFAALLSSIIYAHFRFGGAALAHR